jgi:hypothetical protein
MIFFASLAVVIIIFIINLIPIFMPPTWVLVSFVGFYFGLSYSGLVLLCLFAALASSAGRAALALFSEYFLRNRFISSDIKQNLDVLKQHVEKRQTLTSGLFLAYAFSPLPSGQLFLAYGLANLKLRPIIVPFFAGRFASYLFWGFVSSSFAEVIDRINSLKSGAFLSIYFVLGQIATLYLVYLFTKIDWNILFTEKKLRFIRKSPPVI